MAVYPGDSLKMNFTLLAGTTKWYQQVTVLSTGKSVNFTYDLLAQEQTSAEWFLEPAKGWFASPPSFIVKDIIIKSSTSTIACSPHLFINTTLSPLPTLSCSTPVISGNTCSISNCSFNGGKATTGVTFSPLQNQALCIDLSSNNQTNGASVQLWACNQTPAQKWTWYNGTIQLSGTSKCIDV